jgi:putative transposase
VLLGERHLRLAIAEFIEHYHLERHHQGLDHQLITAPPLAVTPANEESLVVRRERLGGLLNYYHRRAA